MISYTYFVICHHVTSQPREATPHDWKETSISPVLPRLGGYVKKPRIIQSGLLGIRPTAVTWCSSCQYHGHIIRPICWDIENRGLGRWLAGSPNTSTLFSVGGWGAPGCWPRSPLFYLDSNSGLTKSTWKLSSSCSVVEFNGPFPKLGLPPALPSYWLGY